MNRRVPSRRVRASLIHLLCSAAVAALAALIVFRLWFPYPYNVLAGGTTLFLLLTGVDVCLGPALTAVVASPTKPRAELRRDIAVIAAVQLVALAYGLYSLGLARPVLVSFEIDRFRVVAAADIDPALLAEAPETLRHLSWRGPVTIASIKPSDPVERLKSVELGLAGFDLSMLPANWREWAPLREAAWDAARPVELLIDRYPAESSEVQALAREHGATPQGLRFLPIVSRHASWCAILAMPGVEIVGYLPVDGFF
jgi:hypothetical protein